MTQWLIALAPVVLKALLDLLIRLYERQPPEVDKPARLRRRRRIA